MKFIKNKSFKLDYLFNSLNQEVGNFLLLNQRQRHFFHIVSPSPWPFVVSCCVLGLLMSFVAYLHFFPYAGYSVLLAFLFLLIVIFFWFKDIIVESWLSHTYKIQDCILDSFILFIISEVMFFFSFFWGYFYSSISPTLWIFNTWPPLGITTISAFQLPLLNTALLLFSGWTVTWAHKAIVEGRKSHLIKGLYFTLTLSFLFTAIQVIEYRYACFSIYDGVYGSCFFMLTGFHGFHVILGTIMLLICLIRSYLYNFSYSNHVGFIVSAWYWHFVDVVWIFLFIFVYWWGNVSVDLNLIFESLIDSKL